jgi:hypothetical protein
MRQAVTFERKLSCVYVFQEIVRLVKSVVGILPPSSPNMSLLTGLKTALASSSNAQTAGGVDISISVRENVKSNASVSNGSNGSNFSSELSDEQKFRSTALQQ